MSIKTKDIPASSEHIPAIRLENVVFCWPGQMLPTLDIQEFTVQPAEHVFLSGPSGSGKSTLLGLVAGILTATSGRVQVNGHDISVLGGGARDRFRGEHIGFIFQQFNLVPYLSVLENVLIPCRFSSARNKRAEQSGKNSVDAASSLLERLDLDSSLWQRKVTHLSVGQQQRVAAARALIGAPPLIIADEPTSSLDADRRTGFLQLLLRECQAAGSTLLFVSHDQALAKEFHSTVKLQDLNRARGQV